MTSATCSWWRARARTARACRPRTTTRSRRLPEVMKGADGTMHLIRQKQTLEQILVNEVELPDAAC